MYILVSSFFHWWEIEQINKTLNKISKFELRIKKIKQTRQEFEFVSFWCQFLC